MIIHSSPTKWFYDDQLYYRYLALSGSEQELEALKQFLNEKQIRVYKSSASHRPASNGRMYDWYMRVQELSPENLVAIRSYFETSNGASSSTSDGLERLFHLTLEINAKTDKIQATIAEAGRHNTGTEARLESISKQNETLIDLYRASVQAVEQHRERIDDLQNELIEIVRGKTNANELASIQQRYDETITSLRQELVRSEEDLNRYIASFDPERDALNNRVRELENQISSLGYEKATLLSQLHQPRLRDDQKKDNPSDTWRQTVRVLLPEIELVGGSLDTLWHEMPDPNVVLKEIKSLDQMKAKQVHRAPEWKEVHLGKDWRLYFRQCALKSGHPKYQVLVGAKSTQEHDIAYLMNL
jgi:DNA repair exonuclease SbcCD ATPase subunit